MPGVFAPQRLTQSFRLVLFERLRVEPHHEYEWILLILPVFHRQIRHEAERDLL